jgi:ATP-binding cassette subfamily C protein CydCD
VTGPSGSGKSTLLAVLAGELAPETGRGTGAARRQVAWVPQRPWLEGRTVRDLLVVARPDATDADLWAALARVDLSGLVAGLPGGLDAAAGEDGARFSGGQRARLALARAVLARRPLVLVDEPSAHLDPATEQVVVDALTWLAQTSTVVVVTHAPRLVEAADRVLRLRLAPAREAALMPTSAVSVPVPTRPVPDEQPAARRTAGWGDGAGPCCSACSPPPAASPSPRRRAG